MTNESKPKDLIKRYSSALIDGLIKKVSASSPLKHRLTKGELRELFITNVLKQYLTSQFDIGTGIIINQKGEQSNQIDIVIYDNRILPPFIKEQHIGIYPAESVVGTIEIKSKLDKNSILKAEESAKFVHDNIYNSSSSIYNDLDIWPIAGIVGFYGHGCKELNDQSSGINWLNRNLKTIFALCLIGRFSWLNIKDKGWAKSTSQVDYEETKRFIAVFLDNVRTISEMRLQNWNSFAHKDWLGAYIRKQ